MPVSSPSYFPSVRTTDQVIGITSGSGHTGNNVFLANANAGRNSTIPNLIVIGGSALSGGVTDATNILSAVVLGQNAAAALVSGGTALQIPGGMVVIGSNAMQANPYSSACVIIGDSALKSLVANNVNPTTKCVIIGDQAMSNNITGAGRTIAANVVIGYKAGLYSTAQGFPSDMNDCVFIGREAAGNYYANGANGIKNTVAIGSQAAINSGQSSDFSQSVFVGAFSATTANSVNMVAIGYAAQANAGASNTFNGSIAVGASTLSSGNGAIAIGYTNAIQGASNTNCISIGASSSVQGANSIYIGGTITVPTGTGNIYIGDTAGTAEPVGNDKLLIETGTSGARKGALYADMNAGNVILGRSTPATNRDFGGVPGTNMLKLLNGTVATGANIVGGGYFYVNAGALHWVDSNGVDNALSGAGAEFIGIGTGVIDPGALAAGSTANYAPAGFGASQIVRLTPNAAGSTLSGLAGGAPGRVVTLINNGTGPSITLTNLDAGSTAANQFATPSAANLVIVQNSAVQLWYDSTGPHWHALSWS